MRLVACLVLLSWVLLAGGACVSRPHSTPRVEGSLARTTPPPSTPIAPVKRLESPPRVDFETEIRPILEMRCQPCHFEGGKQYARMPFDQSRTILDLGTKLFSRIKDPEEQAFIQKFLDQEYGAGGDQSPSEPVGTDGA